MGKLREIAYAVSGDKGDSVNIAVIAYEQKDYVTLTSNVTPEKVAAFFSELKPKKVHKYELPNLWALNFVLEGVLQGGLAGLEVDSQGKALGQQILEMEL